MTNQEFINGVWEKYDNYIKTEERDRFFIKNLYASIKFKRNLRIISNMILALISTAGIVYAGTITYEIIQKSTKTDFQKNRGYDYNQNMIYNNSMYYKKIHTYEEYLDDQKLWNNLIDMQEEDFKDYFVVILAGENYDTTSLYVSNIYEKDQKLCIELRKKDTWSIDNTVISVKIPKELDREEIDIINLPNEVNTSDKYQDINSITEEYTIEDAIEDKCFVVKENKIISPDKKQLDNFVNNCNNKVEDLIRIYIQEVDNVVVIYDIEYKNNRINMVSKIMKSNNDRILYHTGNEIVVRRLNSAIEYSLYDEIGNQTLFCRLEV